MGRAVLEACLPWLALFGASCVLLRLLVRLNHARWDWSRLRHLHRDEVGSAQSLSFVLTLPIFVMVLLFIVQVSQLMIGTIVVHYGAYAAARSAIVWIPARLEGDVELENCISSYLVDEEFSQVVPILDPSDPNYGPSAGGMTFRIAPGSAKYRKIASAAVMAVAPICPSRELGLSVPSDWLAIADTMVTAFGQTAPAPASGGAIPRRMHNKLAYAAENTEVELRFYHDNSEPPLVPWHIPPEPEEFRMGQELGWQDTVTVTVRHNLALLPGPGRLLARAVRRRDGAPDRVSQTIRHNGKVYVYPLTASVTLGLEGEKSVIPYVESME